MSKQTFNIWARRKGSSPYLVGAGFIKSDNKGTALKEAKELLDPEVWDIETVWVEAT